jgi:hypothetical protein
MHGNGRPERARTADPRARGFKCVQQKRPQRARSTGVECTIACIDAHGAPYVLYDGKDMYRLSDQQTPEKSAGKRVTVTCTLNADTKAIQVDSITLAK